MLAPKKVKHRKWHKGRKRWSKTETRGTKVDFGSFGLKSDGLAWITSRQIEAARRAMTRHIDRIGKTWIRIFPDKPVTKKGDETAMGQGKGSLDHYVAVVRPGRIIFEIDGVAEDVAREAFRLAAAKLPVLTKFVKRQ